ncbi:MAG: YybS family protein [Gemmatimonadetes bacterium]|nr:YybS family protein [Gemmatimonadota bacterium]
MAAVTGAVAVTSLILRLAPGGWSALDWGFSERMRSGISTALQALSLIQGDAEGLSPALVATLYRTAEVQAQVFPAMLGLASLASLGVAWWIFVRLGFGSQRGLGPLREFRFNDHLVWLFIGGLVMLVAGGDGGAARAGSNAVVFMGALYALRGAAVVVFLGGGMSALGALLLALGLLFVAPVILAGALAIGLGDTWLDVRRRIREAAA